MSLTEIILKIAYMGSQWVLYVLVFLSVLSVAVIIERIVYFFRNTRGSHVLQFGIRDGLERRGLRGAQAVLDVFVRGFNWRGMKIGSSIEARVLRRALPFAASGPQALSDAVESELAVERKGLDRGMNLLGTLGNNAPFIGLFGTVIGVIQAFAELGVQPAQAEMGNIMTFIAEALVATGVGIFVAIPAVVAFNSAQKASGAIETRINGLTKLLSAHLHAVESNTAQEVQTASRAISPEAGRNASQGNVGGREPVGSKE